MLINISAYIQVLVGSYEQDVAQLILEVHSQGFDSVAHRVSCTDAWQVLQEAGDSSLLLGLLKVLIVILFGALLSMAVLATSLPLMGALLLFLGGAFQVVVVHLLVLLHVVSLLGVLPFHQRVQLGAVHAASWLGLLL